MWRGSILSLDGALQLLLIVDYVFDWARDIYREDILRELRLLTSGEDETISVIDTDIYSTRGACNSQDQTSNENHIDHYMAARKVFTDLDCSSGVVRHASFVESRYCCIYLTRDTLPALYSSTNLATRRRIFGLILSQRPVAISMDQEGIEMMEQEWTGTTRHPPPDHAQKTLFYTISSYTTYLSPDWHLIRELFTIAVARDVWAIISTAEQPEPACARKQAKGTLCQFHRRAAQLRLRRYPAPKHLPRPFLNHRRLSAIISHLRSCSPERLLLAAIARVALMITDDDHGSIDLFRDTGEKRAIVYGIYENFKRGIQEPPERFLRLSSRCERVLKPHRQKEPENWHYVPGLIPNFLQASHRSCILIHAGADRTYPSNAHPDVCAYFTEGNPEDLDMEDLGFIIKKTFEDHDVYHTTRDNEQPSLLTHGLGRGGRLLTRLVVPWNIHDTYGIYMPSTEFESPFHDLMAHLGAPPPTRQGSPRHQGASGNYLHTRNIIPWMDPRRVGRGLSLQELRSRMFISGKILMREFRYWQSVTEERQKSGVTSCKACASTLRRGICYHCRMVIASSDCPQWLDESPNTDTLRFPHGNVLERVILTYALRESHVADEIISEVLDELFLSETFMESFESVNEMLSQLRMFEEECAKGPWEDEASDESDEFGNSDECVVIKKRKRTFAGPCELYVPLSTGGEEESQPLRPRKRIRRNSL